MSPVGDAFRSRCRMFPSLVNCCTIDWFISSILVFYLIISCFISFFYKNFFLKSLCSSSSFLFFRFVQWPEEALLSVAKNFFSPVDELEDNYKEALAKICVTIHISVTNMAEKFVNYLVLYFFYISAYIFIFLYLKRICEGLCICYKCCNISLLIQICLV